MAIRKGPVLIVDDDIDVREAIRDTLEEEGYESKEATDGQSALNYLEQQKLPALILLDWNMRPMSGKEFLDEFAKRPQYQNVPVMLLTADVKAEEKSKAYPGLTGYLKKPVHLDSLLQVLENCCGEIRE